MKEFLKKRFPIVKKIKKKFLILNSLRNELVLILCLKKKQEKNVANLLLWQKQAPYIGKYGIISCDPQFKKLALLLLSDDKICLNTREMWNIYNIVKKTTDNEGDIAEVGVYSGGSAKLMAEVNPHKKIYLFDTFTGIPENDFAINKIDRKMDGDSLDKVKSYLSSYKNLLYYSGIFPQSAISLDKKNLKFSFVHLDVDVYEGTFDSLTFFYPLMSKGGVILTHDYDTMYHPGVKKAFDDFFKDKPEKIQVAWDSVQAFVVKI